MENNDQNLWTYHQTSNADVLSAGNPRQDLIFKKISRIIPTGNLLEIGFGNGYLLEKLSKKYNCFGADISVKNVEQMRKRISNVEFDVIKTDGVLPYEDLFFDGFIASEVLEHMSDEELQVSISEIKRVLRPGGVAIITVPAEENFQKNECFCPECCAKFHKWGHKQYWDKKKIKSTFNDFKILKIIEYYNKYFGKNLLENFLGEMMWIFQTALNKIIKFPNKIFSNRTYIIIIKK